MQEMNVAWGFGATWVSSPHTPSLPLLDRCGGWGEGCKRSTIVSAIVIPDPIVKSIDGFLFIYEYSYLRY